MTDDEPAPPVDPVLYERERDLGRGGMGRVWAARDRRLGRLVAVKELLPGREGMRARFTREARIAARLSHPSIVPVHEQGVWPDGQPFYTMTLVAGDTLDSALARRRTLEERLALLPSVIAIADALAYAHSERIIHRDVKPQNIVLGEFGEALLVDWGLAKDLAAPPEEPAAAGGAAPASDETNAGTILGTPGYMAPEQARAGAASERSDVYALGAVLYRLVAGVAPVSGGSASELLERAAFDRPQPLAEREPDAPPDLVAIVDKAMAPRPADRYPDAAALVADLKRFQTGQLVGVHRYTARQLVRRWVERQRTAVAVAAIFVAALLVVSALAFRRVVAERDVAQTERAGAEKLVDFMLTTLRDKLDAVGRLDALRGVGAGVVDYYDSVGAGASRETLQRRADALLILGDADNDINDRAAAARSFHAAAALREKLAALDPGDEGNRYQLARLHARFAAAAYTGGRLEEARAGFQRVVDETEALVVGHPETIRMMRSYNLWAMQLATVLRDGGDWGGAQRLLTHTLAISMRSADPIVMTRAYANLGEVQRLHDPAAAVRSYAAAASIAEAHAAGLWRDARALDALLSVRIDQLNVLLTLHAHEAALAAGRRAQEVGDRYLAIDPSNTNALSLLAHAESSIAWDDYVAGRWDHGIATASRAVAHDERLLRSAPENTLWRRQLSAAQDRLGNLFLDSGALDAAIDAFTAAMAHAEALVAGAPGNRDDLRWLSALGEHLAEAERRAGKSRAALAHMLASLAAAREVLAGDPKNAIWRSDIVGSYLGLAEAERAAGDAEAALRADLAAYALALTIVAPDDEVALYLGHAERDLADALRARGQGAAARALAAAAVARGERLCAALPDDMWNAGELALSLETLARADPAAARASVQRAIALLRPFAAAGTLSAASRRQLDELLRR